MWPLVTWWVSAKWGLWRRDTTWDMGKGSGGDRTLRDDRMVAWAGMGQRQSVQRQGRMAPWLLRSETWLQTGARV